jgi:hypothetical protein
MFFSGMAKANLGDLGGALRTLERMRKLMDDYGLAYYRAGVETTLAWVWRELGERHRARELAERALQKAGSGSGVLELEQTLHALLGVADSCLLDGDQAQAAALAEAAVPLLDRRLPFHARAELRPDHALEPGPLGGSAALGGKDQRPAGRSGGGRDGQVRALGGLMRPRNSTYPSLPAW